MSDTEAILRWLAVLSAITAGLAPFSWWLGAGLGPALYGLARPLGIVALTAVVWWPAAALGLPFTRVVLITALVLASAACWTMWRRSGQRINWRAWLAFEVLWLLLFAGYALFRAYNPDIANTEKPMDIALLSSVSRSANVPAPDPWFAGEAINYYYFGYQVFGAIVKLSGVPTTIAFNLALATLFASLGTVAAAGGYRLATSHGLGRRLACVSAALTTFLLLIAGNLETGWRLVRSPGETLASGWWYDDVGWQASRVIVDHGVHGSLDPSQTINEFPAFSFILGDLHPHVLTYPLLLSIAVILIGIVCCPRSATLARTATLGALIGLLYVSNSWDAPLGFAMLAGALLLALGIRRKTAWLHIGLAGASAVLTALPFVVRFTAPVGLDSSEVPDVVADIPLIGTLVQSLGIVTWQPSGMSELLLVHGFWLAVFVMFAGHVLSGESPTFQFLRRELTIVAAGVLLALAIALLWAPAVLLVGIPLALALTIVMLESRNSIRLVAGLFALAFLLILIPEFVYIQDAFGNRMNTVFKLYFQAWLLFSIASAASLMLVVAGRRRQIAPYAWAAVVVLVLTVTPYSLLSARDWTTDFQQRHGLDGADYLRRNHPDEVAAIDWIRRNADDNDVIVEAPGCSYQSVAGIPMNRFSAFSGVPAIVGWAGHERQWRRGDAGAIKPRVDFRQQFANSWLSGEAATMTNVPAPDYIILGLLEREGSETCDSLTPHDPKLTQAALEGSGWRAVFVRGAVMILGRNP